MLFRKRKFYPGLKQFRAIWIFLIPTSITVTTCLFSKRAASPWETHFRHPKSKQNSGIQKANKIGGNESKAVKSLLLPLAGKRARQPGSGPQPPPHTSSDTTEKFNSRYYPNPAGRVKGHIEGRLLPKR